MTDQDHPDIKKCTELINTCQDIFDTKNDTVILKTFIQLRKYSSFRCMEVNIKLCNIIFSSDIFLNILGFLKSSNTDIIFEVLWLITNIISIIPQDVNIIVYRDKYEDIVIDLMNHSSPKIREQSIWLMGNLIGDDYFNNIAHKKRIMNIPHFMDYLITNITYPANNSLLYNSVWTLSNIYRNSKYAFEKIKYLFPIITKLLDHSNTQVLFQTGWMLSYLLDNAPDIYFEYLMSTSIPVKCVGILNKHINKHKIISPYIRVIGNFFASDYNKHMDYFLKTHILNTLSTILKNSFNSMLQKELLWILSNLSCGRKTQLKVFCSHDIFDLFIDTTINVVSDNIFCEGVWVMVNLLNSIKLEKYLSYTLIQHDYLHNHLTINKIAIILSKYMKSYNKNPILYDAVLSEILTLIYDLTKYSNIFYTELNDHNIYIDILQFQNKDNTRVNAILQECIKIEMNVNNN